MEKQSSDLEARDEYVFPLPYPPEVLEQMKQRLSISQEVFQNIHSYFDAASHLYARISLRMLFKIYNSQNPPVCQEDFLEAAEIIAHEKHTYVILQPEVFHEDAAPSQPMDQELVPIIYTPLAISITMSWSRPRRESPGIFLPGMPF